METQLCRSCSVEGMPSVRNAGVTAEATKCADAKDTETVVDVTYEEPV